MSVSASSISITPKQHPSAIGVPECSSDWLRPAEASEAKANGYHQVSSNYRLPLIVASIKSLTSGTRLR
jgi:hypothetical protein